MTTHPPPQQPRGAPSPGQRLLLRALLGGWLPRAWAQGVHRAIAKDAAWSAAYDAARRAERAASLPGGKRRAFSAGQIDLVEDLIFAQLDAAQTQQGPQTQPAPAWWQQWMPLAAAAALVVVFVNVPSNVDDAYTARGGDAAEGARVGVRARCIDKDARRVVDEAEAGPRAPADSLRCPRGSLLSLSVTNLDDADVYVYAVGVADDGALRFFSPFDEPASSVKVARGTVDDPLDVVADTAAFPDDKGVALFTLFSARPLRGPDVARTLRDVQQRTGHVQALDRLPFDALTTRIDLLPNTKAR